MVIMNISIIKFWKNFLNSELNAQNIYGYTPLFYALLHVTDERMAVLLLKYGADPNHVNRRGERPLTLVHRCNNYEYKPFRNIVDILIEHNGRLNDKKHEHVLRSKVEQYGDKDFVARIRKAMPREENKCEKCLKSAVKKCASCCLVFYCSQTCQKLDWKFHKVSCNNMNTK